MDHASQITESIFTGPGEVLLAPETWGDIVPIMMDGTAVWSFSKHAFLGATMGIQRTVKSQGIGKGLCKHASVFPEVSFKKLDTQLPVSLWRRFLRVASARPRRHLRAKFRCHSAKAAGSRRAVGRCVVGLRAFFKKCGQYLNSDSIQSIMAIS